MNQSLRTHELEHISMTCSSPRLSRRKLLCLLSKPAYYLTVLGLLSGQDFDESLTGSSTLNQSLALHKGMEKGLMVLTHKATCVFRIPHVY